MIDTSEYERSVVAHLNERTRGWLPKKTLATLRGHYPTAIIELQVEGPTYAKAFELPVWDDDWGNTWSDGEPLMRPDEVAAAMQIWLLEEVNRL